MNKNLEKANQALLDGDRDGVLKLLQNEPDTAEVIWLRANSVLSDEERKRLLSRLINEESRYSQLAREFLDRENNFQAELDEPPDYKFWLQPNYKKRAEKMREYRTWIIGAILLLALGIFGIVVNINYESENDKFTAGVRATQTAQAFFAGQQFAEYSAGRLSIIDVIDQVDTLERPVTFGDFVDDQFKPVSPAEGARFLAVLINFQCVLPVCNQPPEADLALLLADDKITASYNYSSRPFFIDEPPSEFDRIASGKSIRLWFVFEVPRITSPKALLVITPDRQEPLIVSWPVY